MKLEELARTSSDAARVSVSHLDLPPLGEQRPGRSWVAPALAATGVAALLVAGLVVVDRFNDGDTDVADDVVPVPVEVPRLALPDDSGWAVTSAVTASELVEARGVDRPVFTYYGDADAGAPFEDGDLLIASFSMPPSAESEPSPDGDAVEVRGATGSVTSGTDAGLPAGTTSLEWTDRDANGNGLEIILVSRTYDADRLVAIADDLTIDHVTGDIEPGTELGLERVAVTTGTPFDAFRTTTEGYLIGYQGSTESDFLVLSTGRGDIEDEAVVLRWWLPEVSAVTVAGRPGYQAEPAPDLVGTGRILIWAPADGIVANLTHFTTEATLDLVSLAERTVDVDETTWQTLLDEHGISSVGEIATDAFDEIYGESAGEIDGEQYSWVLGVQGDQLCFELATAGGSTGSCQPRIDITPPDRSARTIDNSLGETVTNVLIAADPAVESVREATSSFRLERVDADGVAWFVAIGPSSIRPEFEVVIDGEIVDVLDVSVEGLVEETPGAIGDHRVATELGLSEDDILVSGVDEAAAWWLGLLGTDLCLATTGSAEATSCRAESDLAVFEPVETDNGLRTFVVLRDLPACVESVTLDVEGAAAIAGAESADHRYELWSAPGDGDGWSLQFVVGVRTETIALPGDDGGAWPSDLCT